MALPVRKETRLLTTTCHAPERWRRQVSRRPSTKEQRVDLDDAFDSLQFKIERFEIGTDQVVASGDEREVAITAPMTAEGDMDVDGAVAGAGHLRILP